MTANEVSEERELVDRAIEWLAGALPANWTVQRSNRTVGGGNLAQPQPLADDAIDIGAPNTGTNTLIVEVKRSFSPRDVGIFTERLPRLLRAWNYNVPIIVISEWLSPQTRQRLDEQAINYLDLTGNVLLRLENPTVFIRSAGAARAPKPAERGKVRLRGPKAARVVRLLLDVRPPYGVRDVAEACDVALSYVSRLLEALDRDALIERSGRGRVESVDIPALLRRWARAYDVFTTNDTATFLAPQGAGRALDRLKTEPGGRVAITGSFAAVRRAPVAAPALLVAYTDDVEGLTRSLDLLPTDEGSNVALLRAYDPVAWQRGTVEEGLRYVAPSQVAVDCLTGNGRMPAEGEALAAWMAENESAWRLPSLADLASSEPAS